jgi:hypothetical protein
MYRLDFETMRQVMHAHHKTGLLYADLPAGAVGLSEPCQVEIVLQAGVIVSCFFVSRSGRRIKDEEAPQKLTRLGKLDWTFVPQEDARTEALPITPFTLPELAQTPSREHAGFPQRLRHLKQREMVGWSRLHRMVFALADGTRSIEKIADMLSTSPENVRSVLRDLQFIGVIRL